MSNKRITDLTELTTPTTDDVFPVVDIATNTTTKVQLGNLPVPTSVTTALATKQDTLVSGTNIKTVNSTSLVGSGNVAVQETLVSGTNIKTLNSTSLLGSGNIVLTANPSGVAGAIQFSDGSAFSSDATKFFWDNTNKRLGIGTNAPTNTFEIASTTTAPFKVATTAAYFRSSYKAGASTGLFDFIDGPGFSFPIDNVQFGTSGSLGARVGIKGSGSTSATTSLLVQNSAGTEIFKVRDDGQLNLRNTLIFDNNTAIIDGSGWYQTVNNSSCSMYGDAGASSGVRVTGPTYGSGASQTQIKGRTSISSGFNQPDASAQLDISSTTRGFLPPRMTTTQKNAIATPASGLVVYDSTTNKLCCYNGSTWNDLF